MYVNISHADIICPFCYHFNFSKKTAKQLLSQLEKIQFEEEEVKRLNFSIVCDHCQKVFYIQLSVAKHRLVLLIE